MPPIAARTPCGVRGVRHHVEALRSHPPDDDVVEHRRLLVEEVRVLGTTWADPMQVVGEGPWRTSNASDPSRRTVPRWLTSKATASLRHTRCSATVPFGYDSGISHPPKGTIFAPRARCTSWSGDRRSAASGAVVSSAATGLPMRRSPVECQPVALDQGEEVTLVDDHDLDFG